MNAEQKLLTLSASLAHHGLSAENLGKAYTKNPSHLRLRFHSTCVSFESPFEFFTENKTKSEFGKCCSLIICSNKAAEI